MDLAIDAARYARRIAVPLNSKSSLLIVACNKDAFPNRQQFADWTNHSACQNKHRFLA